MKQILRYSFLMVLAFICGNMNAGTIVFADLGLENGTQYTSPFDGGDFTVTFAGGGNDGKYYNTGSGIRVYGNGTMTIAAKSGNLTKIVISYDGTNKPADGTVVDGGTYNAETGTWTGSASSVVFTRPSGSGHWRVQKIEATVEGATPIDVEAPKFSVAGGTYYEPQTVAMSCATEGAKILYTIPAGDDPVYTDDSNYTGVFYDGNPLTISKTTTIKAMAVKDGKTSSIVSATYTIKKIEEINVAKAIEIINALENGKTTEDIYKVKGFIVGTPDFQRDKENKLYGNVNFTIADEKGGTTTLTVFRAKDLENVNFTEETINRIKEGDFVVVQGKLQKYVKDEVVTPELTNGYLISVNAGSTTTTYKITVTNTEHGNITLDKYEAAAGEKVNVIDMKVDDGYEMNEPTITAANGEVVTIGGSDEEGHYIIMPASDVVIALNISKLYLITVNFDSSMGDVRGISFDSEKSPNYKAAGKNVEFTVTPKSGYKIDSVTAADDDNNPITVNVAEDKSYYEFEMPAKNVTITAVFSAAEPDTWTVAGTQPLVGTSWDPSDTSADMTSTDGVNFTYVKEDITLEQGTEYKFKVVKNHAWAEAYPGSDYIVTVTETAKYKATITFNATTKEVNCVTEKTGSAGTVTHTWSVIGNFKGDEKWTIDYDMVKGDDGLFKVAIKDVAKGKYEFKVRADHAWDIAYPSSNYKLEVENDNSTVTVTFNEETKAVNATVSPATGIATAKIVNMNNTQIYNVAGQKVTSSYKGLVIVNGKKMMQK